MYATCVWCLCSLKRIADALDWNPGHYEMPGVGAGNRTQGLHRNSEHSLESLSSPVLSNTSFQ